MCVQPTLTLIRHILVFLTLSFRALNARPKCTHTSDHIHTHSFYGVDMTSPAAIDGSEQGWGWTGKKGRETNDDISLRTFIDGGRVSE